MNMKRMINVFLILAAAGATAFAAERVIILKGGAEIKGDVLKDDDKAVVVDIGCEVIRLPRSQVVRIFKGKAATTRPATTVEKKGDKRQLYRTAVLNESTIKDNAERYGQAVVMVTTPGGLGSGFIITPDGYLITNYHVVANETRIKITVFSRNDQGYERTHYKNVKIIALNPFLDLALLKIEGKDPKKKNEKLKPFKYAYMGDMKKISDGDPVFAIGNPLGLTRTVSQGIVSTRNRNFSGQLYIQTTTAINPGNSGGPLFNLRGEVIGVTSMGYLYLGGLNFAIPVDVVKRFVSNRDAFAYDEDNPNSGFRYLQPAGRINKTKPSAGKIPTLDNRLTG